MHSFFQILLLELGPAVPAGIIALGIVLIYRASGVLNLALGETGVVAMLVAYSLGQNLPLWVALLAGCMAGGVLSVATYAATSRAPTSRFMLFATVTTVIIALLIALILRLTWGTARVFPSAFSTSLIAVGRWEIPQEFVAALVIGLLLLGTIQACVQWTWLGAALRAAEVGREASGSTDGSNRRVVLLTWAVAGALAAVAGFFESQIVFDPTFLTPLFVSALAASIAAGLRSLPVAFAGAIFLEIARSVFQIYIGDISPRLTGYVPTFLLAVIVLVVLVSPVRRIAGSLHQSG